MPQWLQPTRLVERVPVALQALDLIQECVRHAVLTVTLCYVHGVCVCAWVLHSAVVRPVACAICCAKQDSNLRRCMHAACAACAPACSNDELLTQAVCRTCVVVVVSSAGRLQGRELCTCWCLLRERAIPVRLFSPPSVWGASGILSLVAQSSQECMLSHDAVARRRLCCGSPSCCLSVSRPGAVLCSTLNDVLRSIAAALPQDYRSMRIAWPGRGVLTERACLYVSPSVLSDRRHPLAWRGDALQQGQVLPLHSSGCCSVSACAPCQSFTSRARVAVEGE